MRARIDEMYVSDTAILQQVDDERSTRMVDRWGASLLFALAALALMVALRFGGTWLGMAGLGVALIACVAGVVLPRIGALERWGDLPVVAVLALVLVAELFALFSTTRTDAAQVALLFTAVIAGSSLATSPWLGRAQIPLLCLSHLTFSILTVLAVTEPTGALHAGTSALIRGENPYAAGAWHDLPLPLILAAPSQFLAGNAQFSVALASTAAGAFLAYARPGRAPGICASLLFLLPQGVATVAEVRSEMFSVLLLCAAVFCAGRYPRAFPFVLGLLFTTRLGLLLALPAALVLTSLHTSLRAVLIASLKVLLTLTAVVTPFLIWNPHAFIQALTTFDPPATAAGFGSWLPAAAGFTLPPWLGVALAVALLPLVIGRATRTPAGVAAAVGLISFGLFALTPSAGPGEYVLVLSSLLAAVALTGLSGSPETRGEVRLG